MADFKPTLEDKPGRIRPINNEIQIYIKIETFPSKHNVQIPL